MPTSTTDPTAREDLKRRAKSVAHRIRQVPIRGADLDYVARVLNRIERDVRELERDRPHTTN